MVEHFETDGAESDAAGNAPSEVTLDSDRQISARRYALQQRYLMLVDLAISGVAVILFLVSGASRSLEAALRNAGLIDPFWLVAAYTAAGFALYTLLMLPLGWFAGFRLPHRYGLSTQSLGAWVNDQVKSFVVGLVVALPVVEIIYWFLRGHPDDWWLYAAGFLILFTVVMGHLAPVLIVPLFYRLTPLRDAELRSRVGRLAERTGTRIAGVYTIDLSRRTKAANALVMGLGSTKRIALGDTLYLNYHPDEIETIIAHELGHQVHHDLELGILVQSALLLGGTYVANRFLHWGLDVFGFAGPADPAAMPLVALALGVFSLITMPLTNGYSRWRERLADQFAVRITGNKAAFTRAMLRLANQNLSEVDPPRWVVWLLYSHPPIAERVRTEA